MTKKEQKRYERQIDEVATSLLMKAHSEAFKITERVYLDILLRMRTKIDENISFIQKSHADKT